MARPGVRKIYRYSEAFKATAVRLSQLPGVEVQSVATSLDVHPFLLSRWRRMAREGKLVVKRAAIDETTKAELKELRKLKRDHARLLEEHDLLKKFIRFSSELKARSLLLSPPGGKKTGSK